VGIWIDLGQSHHIDTVTVKSPDRNFLADIRVSNDQGAPSGPESFGNPVGTAVDDQPVAVGGDGRRILVWIVQLPPTLTMRIADIEVVGG